jgi:hypothetical protein
MSRRYLVRFTTPTEGGWGTSYAIRFAIVTDENEFGSMPFGWQPQEIAGLPVQEIDTIQLLHDGDDAPFIVSGERDSQIFFDDNGLDIPFDSEDYGVAADAEQARGS